MTSNTAPVPFIASTNSADSGNAAFRAFNRSTANDNAGNWISGNAFSTSTGNANIAGGVWLAIHIGEARPIQRYVTRARSNLTVTADAQTPRDWVFEGSNDGVEWDMLDTRVNQPQGRNSRALTYTLNSNVAYSNYRIRITRNHGNSAVTLGELELYDNSRVSIPNIPTANGLNQYVKATDIIFH
jgi:hypothetical protein